MATRRITLSDIAYGQPLAWDVYTSAAAARPFLKKGDIVAPGQLDGWLEAGLYADAGAPTSVLLELNQINRSLERMLLELREHGAAHGELKTLAQALAGAVQRGPEVALAAIFLNQIAGTYAVRHCTEAAIVATLAAASQGKPTAELAIVAAAAMTMNVSMVRQTELFQGRDSALSPDERQRVQRHPVDSVDKLRWAGVDDDAWLELVLLHHENDDGSGYPHGRLGHEITENARLIGLADRYCAYVSARNYRKSLLAPEALQRLRELPVQADAIAALASVLGAFPPGTLVRLENGECGVVTARARADQALRVHVLRDAAGPADRIRSTLDDGCAVAEALSEDSARLRFSMKQIWGDLASV